MSQTIAQNQQSASKKKIIHLTPGSGNSARRTFFMKGCALLAGGVSMPALLDATPLEDGAFLLHEVKVLNEMADNAYNQLWTNLGGITEKELDWKPNAESNSVRWVVGHLYWFEEWMADAIEKKARYLTDKIPISIQDIPYEELKKKFASAHNRRVELVSALTPSQLADENEINYMGRFNIPIRYLLRVHIDHFSGHRYQVRYIRGTYSRVFHTRKADFDPW